MLIDGAGTFDFSENHSKECNWREVNNFQYPNPGDYWGSCDGGNAFMMASLFSQTGTVTEACDPHQDYDVDCKSTCPYQKTLLDWRLINGGVVPNTEVLKQYIYDNGPVITTMYVDSGKGFNSSYDGSYTLNYTTPGDSINHCVLIVGWSDDLPPVSGGTNPADGWIVKNSWGTGWGDAGYFYMTYGAANIGTSSSFVHDWQDYDPDGDIWYYDDDGLWGFWGFMNQTAWGLAQFTPNSNTNVTRVEFWTTDPTSDVDVYVYDDFDGSTLSGKLAEVLDNSYSEAGYHSVELSSPVPVTSGDDVIAVVKFTNESYRYPIAADPHGTVETGRTYISRFGSNWIDMGTTHNTDVAIRLRTSTGTPQGPTLTGITPSSAFNTGIVHITNLAGTNFQAGASVKLARLGQADINATNVNVVSSSRITCDFDLTGAAIGLWDVVVTNPDARDYRLSNSFIVRAPGVLDHSVYLPLVMRRWPPIPEKPVLDPIDNSDGDGNYTVSWSASSGATSYILEEATTPSFAGAATVHSGAGTSTPISGKGPATYFYRVRAINSWGSSGWSDTRSVVVQGQPQWVTIVSEDFEGAFPNGIWEVHDNDSDSGRYYWGRRDCRDHGGDFGGWSVGTGDTTLSCGSDYPNDVSAWMIYGPFSLADATAAELFFDWWSDTEYEYDAFMWGASIDGEDYYGTMVTGDWSSWETDEKLDLSDVPTLGSLLGEDQAWIAFAFFSDESITDRGSFLDNILLRKYTGAAAVGGDNLASPPRVPKPNQTIRSGSLQLRP